jgi:hypothetical protein
MHRVFRWLAAASFVSLPVILWLGRPTASDCGHAMQNPCGVYRVPPEPWQIPAFLFVTVMGLVFLTVAARRHLSADELP